MIRELRKLGAVAVRLGDVEVAFENQPEPLPLQSQEEKSEEEEEKDWMDLALWSSA